MDDYFDSYGRLWIHRQMLGDAARTQAYKDAIEQSVGAGDVVLDLGTGTGILSLFAAAAGARQVYAVDKASVIAVAKEVAAANRLDDRIEFRHGLAEGLELPAPVDVLVSEWMGYFALEETMFLSLLRARDRHLEPEGRMVPSHVRLYLSPVEDTELYRSEGVGLWQSPLYGFDFSSLLPLEIDDLRTAVATLEPDACLAPPVRLVEIDCRSAKVKDFFFDARVEFTATRSGTMHGFCGHFDAQLSESVVLSTGPAAPPTHWEQLYFPVPGLAVEAGDRLVVDLCAREPEPEAPRSPTYLLDYEHHRGGVQVSAGSFFYRNGESA